MPSKKTEPKGELAYPDPPQWLAALEMVETDDDVAEKIGERIMNATSLKEALSASGQKLDKARDFVDRNITIERVSLRRTNLGCGAYAVIEAVDHETEEAVTISCGAENVLRMLVKAQISGWYPFPAMFREAPSKSNPGQSILWLDQATDEPF
jgi:hypothetical protein